MIKFVSILLAFLFVILNLWFLTALNNQKKQLSSKVLVKKLPSIDDKNSTTGDFFDTKLWILTNSDHIEVKKVDANISVETQEKNETITIVSQQGTRKLCKGKRCLAIKAIMAHTLLLKDEVKGKLISLKPSQMVFDTVKLVGLSDTKLFFKDNETGERYELEFFSYRQKRDTNKTKQTKDHK